MLLRRERPMLAVLILLDVAFHGSHGCTVSAADIADRSGLARRGIEPLLQALSRSGLLESVRGPRGGYRLGRPTCQIKVSDIVGVACAEEAESDGPRGALADLVVGPFWAEREGELRDKLGTVTLEALLRRAEAAGLERPLAEPIAFSI